MKVFENNPALPKKRTNILLTNLISSYDDLKGNNLEKLIKQVEVGKYDMLEIEANSSIFQKISYYLNFANPKEWLLLMVFSVCISTVIILIDIVSCYGINLRYKMLYYDNVYFGYSLYVITAIFFGLISTSMGQFVSPNSDGSGIPELKVVLSGMNMYQFYDFNSFVGKTIALTCALIAGFEIGRAGPYVHIAGIVSKQMFKIGYFEPLKLSGKKNLLVVSAAAGITLSLGAPLGGIIFSIEQSSTVFLVANIWKSFFVVVFCIISKTLIKNMSSLSINSIDEGGFIKPVNLNYHVFFFVILGILSGFFSAFINMLFGKVAYTRRMSKNKFYNNRFWWTSIVAVICSMSAILIPPMRIGYTKMLSLLLKPNHIGQLIMKYDQNDATRIIINDTMIDNIYNNVYNSTLIDMNELDKEKEIKNIDNPLISLIHPEDGIMLLICFILKTLVVVLSNTANIPIGVLGPILLIGSLFGRIYGHLLNIFFGVKDEYLYAIIVAACFLSGSSHSIAPAVIIFELTGESSYLIHLLIATLISNLIGQCLSVSIFDLILFIRNLPFIATVKSAKFNSLKAKDLKNKILYFS